MKENLTDVSTHYEFGANWKDYADKIDSDAIENAEYGLSKLVPPADILGKTFLDIGSGSGLHSLSALQLGAKFVIAIYRKTPLCWAWKIEKRVFTNSGPLVRSLIRNCFIGAFKLGLLATNRRPSEFIQNYKDTRGMNFFNDIDDWLGGYPYESATEIEIVKFMKNLGFTDELVVELHPKLGLFGTGCSEFRFHKTV